MINLVRMKDGIYRDDEWIYAVHKIKKTGTWLVAYLDSPCGDRVHKEFSTLSNAKIFIECRGAQQ